MTDTPTDAIKAVARWEPYCDRDEEMYRADDGQYVLHHDHAKALSDLEVYYEHLLRAANARADAGESGIYEGIDLCELAAEIERVTITKVIEAVYAIAEERTDGYWSGHANACEEIKYRLQEAWGTPPPAAKGETP